MAAARTASLTWNNVTIQSRADGFVNATQMCQAGGRAFNEWYRRDSTKFLISKFEQKYNTKVVDVKKGKSSKYTQGSWVHPCLATSLALWISPDFAVKVSEWIEEWKELDGNKERYMRALAELQPSRNRALEKEIQGLLLERHGGSAEHETPVGRVDLLTASDVIEIKHISRWKHAVGQVICYGSFFPERQKRIVLFGDSAADRDMIVKICKQNNIKASFCREFV